MLYLLLNIIFRLKYSMTRIGVLHALTFLVLMQCLLSLCNSLPIDRETVDDKNSWWCEPCKELHRKSRHSRQIRSILKDQFDITIHRYNSVTKLYMDEILHKISNSTENLLRKNKWLPRKKFFRKLENGGVKILPELHKNIQLYAATIQRLIDMEIHTQDVWIPLKFRLGNFTDVKSFLNSLRCEIEDEIFEHRLESQLVKLQKKDLDRQIKLPLKVDNLIDGLVKDYTVLRDYHNFLTKCRAKMFNKSRRRRARKNKNPEKLKNKKTSTNNGLVQS